MTVSKNLACYVEGFQRANQAWPNQASVDPRLAWWQALPLSQGSTNYWPCLTAALPQLVLPQVNGISSSEIYRKMVLQGNEINSQSPIIDGKALRYPQVLRLWLADHPYCPSPVLATPDYDDFLWLVRALAHRAEPVRIEPGVHAQAINGLIHWGLIRSFGPKVRASIIILHDAPYGSVPSDDLPINLDRQGWINASANLRLEHELTHLATKTVIGEMRLNLLDELIADTMGMLAALGSFKALIFERCLLTRWHTYVGDLNKKDAKYALSLTLERAKEIEAALVTWKGTASLRPTLLQWLCQQRLDSPITTAPLLPQQDIAIKSKPKNVPITQNARKAFTTSEKHDFSPTV